MKQWTTQQLEAIEYHEESLLVSAAAGSGKTAVLVERIVEMVQGPQAVDIDRLLVVTFTRAAAAEMRDRISLRLAGALDERPSDETLTRQMALINRASIMTIDSFCKKVMDENFHLVDLDPDYQLLDENEASMLMAETMDDVLATAFEEGDPGFLHLANTFGGSWDDGHLVEMVLRLYRFSRSGADPRGWIAGLETSYPLSGASLKETPFFAPLKEEVLFLLEEAQTLARYLMEELAQDPALQDTAYGPFFADETAQIEGLLPEALEAKEYCQLQRLAQKVVFQRLPTVRGVDSLRISILKEIRAEYKKLLCDTLQEWLAVSESDLLALMRKMRQPVAALSALTLRFYDALQEKKRRKNRADFADLEHFCLSILRGPDGQPTEVARGYQTYFAEILIDEYQDSNDVQEAILTAVSKNQENLFMVGDVKQSIYRFRRANPELFLEKYQRFLPVGAPGTTGGRKIQLYRNFRSRPEVLWAVNELFFAIMSQKAGELDYTTEEALIYGASYDAAHSLPIEVDLLDVQSRIGGESDEEKDLDDLEGVELEALHVANRISDWMRQGTMTVEDHGAKRPLAYRDIVILLRATSSYAAIFEAALKQQNIPVFSDTGTGYFESLEIRTVMSVLRVIDNPRQDIPLLAVLRSPFGGFSEDELVSVRKSKRGVLLLDALKECSQSGDSPARERAAEFLERLEHWRSSALHMPLDQFIWSLLQETAYYEYAGAMPGGAQRQANLRSLFQRAGAFEKTSFKGLYHFIRYIDAMREGSKDYGPARTMGEAEDVVRIMSIHKSKGLEFPVVFVSQMNKQFNRRDQYGDLVLHAKQGLGLRHEDAGRGTKEDTLPRRLLVSRINQEAISEEMRILYVAMTRAKEQLVLTGHVQNVEKALERWRTRANLLGAMGLSPYYVLHQNSPLEWLMPVVLHQVAEPMPQQDLEEGIWTATGGEGVPLLLKVWTRADLLARQEALTERSLTPFWQGEELEDPNLLDLLGYRYPFEQATKIPSKVSVSYVKKQQMEALGSAFFAAGDPSQEEMPELFLEEPREPSVPLPEFLKEDRRLSGAERGTALHTAMLHLDPLSSGPEAVQEQIHELIAREILSQEEGASLNPQAIWGFLCSPLGRRFAAAHRSGTLYREEVFYRALAAKDLLPQWQAKDPMMLNGIIDAFFEEDGQWILLDYKTDAVGPGEAAVLKQRYAVQIRLYCEALTALTGKKVREAYLYALSLQEAIPMEL
ncbi:ATP-dependent nuclease, subunit A [Clostridiaceae bacterium JG1575]|nr:ATP-dependent nuclease, subunit A [Clostridiaceae bacterium JG1575]